MSSERIAELFGCVHDLLLEVGYDRLTLDAVAARARTSKATLYRLWGSKSGLVMAALTTGSAKHQPLFGEAPARSLDEAFEHFARSDAISDRDVRMGFMLLNTAAADPEFGATLRAHIITPVVEEIVAVFEAAAERGEIEHEPALFRRLASLMITDLAFASLISGTSQGATSRRELFRTIVRPALGLAG